MRTQREAADDGPGARSRVLVPGDRTAKVSSPEKEPTMLSATLGMRAAVGSVRPGPTPADAELRIGRFTELIANAVAFRSRRSNREGW
jgi:hypothetical protein